MNKSEALESIDFHLLPSWRFTACTTKGNTDNSRLHFHKTILGVLKLQTLLF